MRARFLDTLRCIFPCAMAEPTTEPPSPSAADIKALIEAERTGMAFLHWRGGDGAQRMLMLEPGRERVTIGRTSNADVSLSSDLEVSRTHALLELVGEEWTVIDDGLSRNGSFINGSRVLGRQRLHDRDRLVIGRTQIVFRDFDRGDEADSTARAGDEAVHVPLPERQKKVLIALCRPVHADASAIPATNREIADEIYLSVDAVKAHLRGLFERFGLEALPQNEKRVRLAHLALHSGLVHPRDF
jgi:DNA-binding CsgD family transcriptional regulator